MKKFIALFLIFTMSFGFLPGSFSAQPVYAAGGNAAAFLGMVQQILQIIGQNVPGAQQWLNMAAQIVGVIQNGLKNLPQANAALGKMPQQAIGNALGKFGVPQQQQLDNLLNQMQGGDNNKFNVAKAAQFTMQIANIAESIGSVDAGQGGTDLLNNVMQNFGNIDLSQIQNTITQFQNQFQQALGQAGSIVQNIQKYVDQFTNIFNSIAPAGSQIPQIDIAGQVNNVISQVSGIASILNNINIDSIANATLKKSAANINAFNGSFLNKAGSIDNSAVASLEKNLSKAENDYLKNVLSGKIDPSMLASARDQIVKIKKQIVQNQFQLN